MKKYNVILVRTEYYEATVQVEADSAEQARELADASDVEDWGSPVDADIEVCEGDDAVTEAE